MAKLNDNELTLRNEAIAERFCTLAEQQPLASCNRIVDYLAREYGLTPTGIRYILKERGIDTARPTLIEQPQTLEQ